MWRDRSQNTAAYGLLLPRTGTVIDPPQFRRCLDANLSHSRRKAWRDRIKEAK